jgi:hypothetical protein
MGTAARATGRTAGAMWRLLLWIIFPPAGALASWMASRRRHRNAQARAMARIEVRVQENTEVAKAAARARCATC